MRLSYLLLALTVIAYALVNLDVDGLTMTIVYVGLLLSAIVFIIEGIAVGVPRVTIPTRKRAE